MCSGYLDCFGPTGPHELRQTLPFVGHGEGRSFRVPRSVAHALTLPLTLGVVFVSRPAWTASWLSALTAAGLFAAMIVYSVLLPVPINNQVARWQPESLPANWRQLRKRWDMLHSIRVAVLFVAMVLLVTSVVAPV
jgi:hypothetical protein